MGLVPLDSDPLGDSRMRPPRRQLLIDYLEKLSNEI